MGRFFKKGQRFGEWSLISYLGGGGNGEVWKCSNSSNELRAIKLLKWLKPKSYSRFIDEITVIEKNSDIVGLIPIIEKFLPQNLSNEIPFYIMPLAQSSEIRLLHKSIEEKVSAVIDIAKTLSLLHDRNIYHRDIKPANILYYNNQFCLADFGLVDFPNKQEISIKNEEIGPKWTMAPEMRRESSTADGAKADIYSLAKTLWIYLTGRNKGFDGQYSTESIIDLKKFYRDSYTSPIDNLLIACTDNDPSKRLSANKFIDSLEKWMSLNEDFHERNLQQWFEIQTKLFPATLPKRVIWEDVNDILKILKIVCLFDNLNHVFLPRSGGFDLKDAKPSSEEGCIELDFGLIYIVKPKRLLFESFGFEHQWNYFRLELDELEYLNTNDEDEEKQKYDKEQGREHVSELSPGNYFPYEILEETSYYEDDYLITSSSRQVTRLLRGSFVIFCKRSIYNLIPATYDGRHNKMSTDSFRSYIQRFVDEIKLTNENKVVEEKSIKSKSHVVKHVIEDIIVYRCGWCGNIVDADGGKLDDFEWEYNRKVIEKFGNSEVIQVNGYCCIENFNNDY